MGVASGDFHRVRSAVALDIVMPARAKAASSFSRDVRARQPWRTDRPAVFSPKRGPASGAERALRTFPSERQAARFSWRPRRQARRFDEAALEGSRTRSCRNRPATRPNAGRRASPCPRRQAQSIAIGIANQRTKPEDPVERLPELMTESLSPIPLRTNAIHLSQPILQRTAILAARSRHALTQPAAAPVPVAD